MKSDILHLNGETGNITKALQEVEKAAEYAKLDKKQTLHLRLLGEEMAGLMRQFSKESPADFWVEQDDRLFRLKLTAKAHLTGKDKKRLVSVSSDGENAAAVGTMGKVQCMFEAFMDNMDAADLPFYSMGMTGTGEMMWSLNQYKLQAGADQTKEWDELEKSIIANLADDVTIGIVNDKVEITIRKTFNKFGLSGTI